jgi:hypothetical protein
MRGEAPQQAAIFSYVSPEERVPPEHPLITCSFAGLWA